QARFEELTLGKTEDGGVALPVEVWCHRPLLHGPAVVGGTDVRAEARAEQKTLPPEFWRDPSGAASTDSRWSRRPGLSAGWTPGSPGLGRRPSRGSSGRRSEARPATR